MAGCTLVRLVGQQAHARRCPQLRRRKRGHSLIVSAFPLVWLFERERFLFETGKPHQFLFGTTKPHLHSVHQVVHLWQHQLARQDGLRSWGSQHRRMLAPPNYLAVPPAACRTSWPQAAVQRAIQPPSPGNAKVTLSRWNAFCRPAVSSRRSEERRVGKECS